MPYVRDVMEKEIIVAKERDNIRHLSKVLTSKNISNIPITDSRGALIGVVSEQDIIRAMESKQFLKITAGDIMTKSVMSVKENDSLEYVSKIFVEHPFRRLPVTRGKKVVGSVTRDDIINTFMSDYY